MSILRIGHQKEVCSRHKTVDDEQRLLRQVARPLREELHVILASASRLGRRKEHECIGLSNPTCAGKQCNWIVAIANR